jgi:tetratricopeptide (TPR) repeat protein
MQIIQSYLFSTSGEIALAQGDIDGAERHFREGLEIAERFGLPERMAGLHANLGLVARAREDIPLAIRQLTGAMHEADTLGIQHLAAQIRIWLASITPTEQAITYLTTAEQLARHGGRTLLLSQIMTLKQRHHITQ